MKSFIATFHTHYGALTFFNKLKEAGLTAKIMPVPRKLSSSCGICVGFSGDTNNIETARAAEDIEQIYSNENNNYTLI